ncbi:MAG: CHC2 zinc finger domain-containing protein, partial [Bacteroidales bacterium]|nr:CHC2 zinc finger domain-containing protein [Bacteroidales bacterium]
MIDRPTVQRILDAADIVDVVSEFVTLRKSGANYKG